VKKLRKVNKAKRKESRKAVEERLASQASLMMKHPKECCLCDTPFVRTKETVLTWRVTVNSERVRLTCPDCSALVDETIGKYNGK